MKENFLGGLIIYLHDLRGTEVIKNSVYLEQYSVVASHVWLNYV